MDNLRERADDRRVPPRPRYVVPVTADMLALIARALAPEHVREIRELCRVGPEAALSLSLAASRGAYAALSPDGKPLFLMGVEGAGLLGRTALVWMLAGGAARRHPARVLRSAKWGMERAFSVSGAATLMQFIPAWYTVGLAFARRLGFSLAPLPGRSGIYVARAERADAPPDYSGA